MGVHGPLARSVEDAALLLRAMAGPDPRAPLSLPEPPDTFVLGPAADPRGARIAWSRNLGDLPVDPEVTAALQDSRAALEAMGCVVEEVEPDLTGADEAFEVLRGVGFAHAFGDLLEPDGDGLKDTIVWNTRVGLELKGARVGRALALQTEMFQRMRALLEGYDALALPVSQVAPFPVEQEWVGEIAGVHDGLLPGVDAFVLTDHDDRAPGAVDPRRLHAGRAAGRPAARRAPPRRARPAAPGRRHRARHRGRAARARPVIGPS